MPLFSGSPQPGQGSRHSYNSKQWVQQYRYTSGSGIVGLLGGACSNVGSKEVLPGRKGWVEVSLMRAQEGDDLARGVKNSRKEWEQNQWMVLYREVIDASERLLWQQQGQWIVGGEGQEGSGPGRQWWESEIWVPLTPYKRCLKTVGSEVIRIWLSMIAEVRRKEKEALFYSQCGVDIVVPSPIIDLQRRN